MEISLYENAIDSVKHAIEHLDNGKKENSVYNNKHALLLMFHGAELLLKQLLYFKNPIYIFDKNSVYKKCKDFLHPTSEELLNCRSLDMRDLGVEVCKFYPDKFNKKNIVKILDDAAKERNKIQHFAISTTEKDVISIILKLFHNIINPSLKIIGENIDIQNSEDKFMEILNQIFSFWEISDNTEKVLNFEEEYFKRTFCHSCGQFSLFIIYENNSSYPNKYFCSCCDYRKEEIGEHEYYLCPECGWYTLIYNEELLNGTCLNGCCSANKDGGIMIEMEYCVYCKNYKIEEICDCTKEVMKD